MIARRFRKSLSIAAMIAAVAAKSKRKEKKSDEKLGRHSSCRAFEANTLQTTYVI
jgi:hypothetical protein